jgi:protein-ribulosamine 3-kinase
MAPKIDPAILKALSLDAATTTIASHGGSDFASTFKIMSNGSDGEEKLFFVKQGKGKESEIMFAGKSLYLHSKDVIISMPNSISYSHPS